MDDLRQRITDILTKENYTFKQLADYLNLTESELEQGLINKTLELRYLEEISKSLRVPLYSFFREANYATLHHEKPFFTNKLWQEEPSGSPQKLMEEIEMLKQALAYKQEELDKKLK